MMEKQKKKPAKNKGKSPAVPHSKHTGRRKRESAQLVRRLGLSTIPKLRCTFAKLIREYDRNELTSAKFRDLNSGVRTMLSILSAERDADLERRLEEIEAKLGLSESTKPGLSLVNGKEKTQ